jgi:hypothetical protein
MQEALEGVFAELVLGAPPTRAALRELCARHALGPEDSSALAESFERLLVYRELVRGNLREAIQLSIPRSMARLGPLFDEYFDRFLRERAPSTHYLRDVTTELLEFCLPDWQNDARVPRYLGDLARHESLHIEVSALPAPARDHVAAPLSLDRAVDLAPALRLMRYGHAVHELPEAESDRSEPAARDVSLLVYRSPEHDVRYLELTPLAHGIVQRLLEQQALGQSIQGAAVAADAPLTEAVLEGAARLLADLAERGVVRGPKPAPASRPGA